MASPVPTQKDRETGEKPAEKANRESNHEVDFYLFMRPSEVTVTMNSQTQRFIVNLKDEVMQIHDLMGPAFEKYYFVNSTREM